MNTWCSPRPASSRSFRGPPKVLAIGWDHAGNLLEIIWLDLAGDVDLVIHAMPLRPAFYVLLPQEDTMTDPKTRHTRTGRTLTDEGIDALSTEVADADYDGQALGTRRRGRPSMGSGPAEVVPVRIDPELSAAIEARAEAEHTTNEIIRKAIRRFLEVA